MKKYEIKVSEILVTTYEIEAPSEEEAVEKVMGGLADEVDQEFVGGMELEQVKELDEGGVDLF